MTQHCPPPPLPLPPPPPPQPLIVGKKEEMTEGRKAGRGSKTKPGSHLSSRSGSATVPLYIHSAIFS